MSVFYAQIVDCTERQTVPQQEMLSLCDLSWQNIGVLSKTKRILYDCEGIRNDCISAYVFVCLYF